MKSITLVAILTCFLGVSTFSQAQLHQETNSYAKQVSSYSKIVCDSIFESWTLLIPFTPLDIHKQNGGLLINSNNHHKFIRALEKAKIKYDKLAQKSDYLELSTSEKDLNINCTVDAYFMYGYLGQHQRKLHPTFRYRLEKQNDETKHILTISTGVIKSSKKWFVDSDGYQLSFSSSEEINTFINSLNEDMRRALKNISIE